MPCDTHRFCVCDKHEFKHVCDMVKKGDLKGLEDFRLSKKGRLPCFLLDKVRDTHVATYLLKLHLDCCTRHNFARALLGIRLVSTHRFDKHGTCPGTSIDVNAEMESGCVDHVLKLIQSKHYIIQFDKQELWKDVVVQRFFMNHVKLEWMFSLQNVLPKPYHELVFDYVWDWEHVQQHLQLYSLR